MGYRIGIDVGGTFTDLALLHEETGRLVVEKVPSVPHDPALGIVQGLQALCVRAAVTADEITYLAHGTTVATNALLQRTGARTGLITTRGFRDLLEIARQRRPSLYDLHTRKPEPLVPRARRYEVMERVMATGSVYRDLDMSGVEQALQALGQDGIEALAICFLYSYLRPEHERQVLERAQQMLPGVFISVSSQVLPEFREYERLSTTVTNAFLGPTMAGYIAAFREHVRQLGVPVVPYINQSNGGTMSIDEALQSPVRTVLSGPSAGVVGATWLAQQAGLTSLVTLDMGGTSTDVAVVRQGQAALALERHIAGLPLRIQALDIHTIGAGGGSIAWRDSGGALFVGPQSAGAVPGPACYGRGGMAPTVTDAHLLLGRLAPQGLLGGRLPLDKAAAEDAIATLAAALALRPRETARGIVQVVHAAMARALHAVTVQRGMDPQHMALLAFGGAGPLHASAVARELHIPTIVVPPHPGTLCAMGLLVEDLRLDLVRTWLGPLTVESVPMLREVFQALEAEAEAWLEREGVVPPRRQLSRWLDVRYSGQNYELQVPVPDRVWEEQAIAPLCREFFRRHEERYGFAAENAPLQVVNVRLVARGLPEPLHLPKRLSGPANPTWGLVDRRAVDFAEAGGMRDCPVYDRDRLAAGNQLAGLALVEQFDSTTLIYPGQTATVDEWGFLLIREEA